MPIIIRSAEELNEKEIKKIIREARLSPFNIHWQNFLVAIDGQDVVGVGQIKTHKDGSHELASIAVRPGYQRRGIASEIINRLLKEESGVLYLMCANNLEYFYRRFNFRPIENAEIPTSIGRMARLGRWSAAIISLLTSQKFKIIVMKLETEE